MKTTAKEQVESVKKSIQEKINKLEKEYDEKTALHEKEFTRARNLQEWYYKNATVNIDAHYEGEVRRINQEADRLIVLANKQQTKQLVPMIECIKALYQSFDSEDSDTYPSMIGMTESFNYHITSNPYIQTPAYNPEWSKTQEGFEENAYNKFLQAASSSLNNW